MTSASFDRFSRFAVFVLVAAACFGCGGGGASAPDGTVFTPDQDGRYGSGVDFVADPSAMEGAWSETWNKELEARVLDADVIAVVPVTTFRTSTTPRGERSYHLGGTPKRFLKGSLPKAELSLRSAPGDAGYGAVHGNDSRIIEKTYVMFLKWRTDANDPEGKPEVRWHASLEHPRLVQRIRELLKAQ
jgi:hypothetical protein